MMMNSIRTGITPFRAALTGVASLRPVTASLRASLGGRAHTGI